jgi:hypothetical protein
MSYDFNKRGASDQTPTDPKKARSSIDAYESGDARDNRNSSSNYTSNSTSYSSSSSTSGAAPRNRWGVGPSIPDPPKLSIIDPSLSSLSPTANSSYSSNRSVSNSGSYSSNNNSNNNSSNSSTIDVIKGFAGGFSASSHNNDGRRSSYNDRSYEKSRNDDRSYSPRSSFGSNYANSSGNYNGSYSSHYNSVMKERGYDNYERTPTSRSNSGGWTDHYSKEGSPRDSYRNSSANDSYRGRDSMTPSDRDRRQDRDRDRDRRDDYYRDNRTSYYGGSDSSLRRSSSTDWHDNRSQSDHVSRPTDSSYSRQSSTDNWSSSKPINLNQISIESLGSTDAVADCNSSLKPGVSESKSDQAVSPVVDSTLQLLESRRQLLDYFGECVSLALNKPVAPVSSKFIEDYGVGSQQLSLNVSADAVNSSSNLRRISSKGLGMGSATPGGYADSGTLNSDNSGFDAGFTTNANVNSSNSIGSSGNLSASRSTSGSDLARRESSTTPRSSWSFDSSNYIKKGNV